MNAAFKPDETFRGDFSYHNSEQAIRRFPLPFPDDKYMYSVNIEPHLPGPQGSVTEFAIDIDEHYVAECRERALVLDAEPLRFQALPHMMSSQWDCLELIMESLSRDYPQHFSLTRHGNQWHWVNRPLQLTQRFTFGDLATLPQQPLEYITRQAPGDWVVMDQREGDLWTEAGMVTTQADWSLNFDLGMTFKEWHGPVPLAHEIGVFDRALRYLLNLRLGAPVRRLPSPPRPATTRPAPHDRRPEGRAWHWPALLRARRWPRPTWWRRPAFAARQPAHGRARPAHPQALRVRLWR